MNWPTHPKAYLGWNLTNLLDEAGVVPPLLDMACGNSESKELALYALIKVPLLLKLKHCRSIYASCVIAKCSGVLAKLASNSNIFRDRRVLRFLDRK